MPAGDPVFSIIDQLLEKPALFPVIVTAIEWSLLCDDGTIPPLLAIPNMGGHSLQGIDERRRDCFYVKVPSSRLTRFGIFKGDFIALSDDTPEEGEATLAVIDGEAVIGRFTELPGGRLVITPFMTGALAVTAPRTCVEALFRFHGLVCRSMTDEPETGLWLEPGD
jgi:hypothetical protein